MMSEYTSDPNYGKAKLIMALAECAKVLSENIQDPVYTTETGQWLKERIENILLENEQKHIVIDNSYVADNVNTPEDFSTSISDGEFFPVFNNFEFF